MSALDKFTIDDVEWTIYEWVDGGIIYQRRCPDCDNGLLLAPVRHHDACSGSGFLTQRKDPRL
jgi:ribosomal protein S27AE